MPRHTSTEMAELASQVLNDPRSSNTAKKLAGNKQAFFLVTGLATETLERRFDTAFGVTRTEEERNQLLSQGVQRLERDLQILGDTFALEDDIRRERDYFERLLRENGIEPYQPNQE